MLTDGPEATSPRIIVGNDQESCALSPLKIVVLSDESVGVLHIGAMGMLTVKPPKNNIPFVPKPVKPEPPEEGEDGGGGAVTVTVFEAVAVFPPPEHATV